MQTTQSTKQKEIPSALDLLQKRLKEQEELVLALKTSLAPVLKGDPLAQITAESKCGYPGIYGVIVDCASSLNSCNENIKQVLDCLAL